MSGGRSGVALKRNLRVVSRASPMELEQETLESFRIGPHFEISLTQGLIVTGKPTFDDDARLWDTLLTTGKSIQFAIGEAMEYIENKWGEKSSQIISDTTGWSLETLRNFKWVHQQVPKENRRPELDWSHFQASAALPPKPQKDIIDRAAAGDDGVPWSVARLKQAIKHECVDVPIVTWGIQVTCKTEKARDLLRDELVQRRFECKTFERRGMPEKA